MAARTWDGATFPDEQAAPDDTATPSRSKAMTAVSAFIPLTENSVVLGSRAASAPKKTAFGATALIPASSVVAQALHPGCLRGKPQPGGVGRGAKARDPCHILGAGAGAALLAAALDLRVQRHAIAHDQRADALRPADLVRRQRHKVRAQRLEIAGNPSRPLHRIDMQQPARGMDQRGGLRDRLDYPGFVVGEHQRHQRPRPPLE